MFELEQLSIAIIGLGYVCLPLAVEFGKHRLTIGFDINQQRIEQLKQGFEHTLQTSAEELQAALQLKYSSTHEDLN